MSVATPAHESPKGLTVDTNGGVLVISGEIDAHTCTHLETALSERASSGSVYLDLDGVTFIDSSGLHVLLDTHNTTTAAGHVLQIRRASDAVIRLLHITALTEFFPLGCHGTQ